MDIPVRIISSTRVAVEVHIQAPIYPMRKNKALAYKPADNSAAQPVNSVVIEISYVGEKASINKGGVL